jgi:hypothetical protein
MTRVWFPLFGFVAYLQFSGAIITPARIHETDWKGIDPIREPHLAATAVIIWRLGL